MDILGAGSFPLTERGNSCVVVFTDYFTKWVEALPASDHTALTVARLLVENVVCRHGAPVELLSDQGREFMGSLVAEVSRLCSIQNIHSTAYAPQTQGLVERFNGTLQSILRSYVAKEHENWDLFLPYALSAYHNVPQKSTGESPFFLVYGRDCRMPSDIAFQAARSPYIDIWADETFVKSVAFRFTAARKLALDLIEQAQGQMKTRADELARPRDYQPQDLVLVYSPQVHSGDCRKLASFWLGPYLVSEVKKPTLILATLGTPPQLFRVHCRRVKPFVSRKKRSREADPQSPPSLIPLQGPPPPPPPPPAPMQTPSHRYDLRPRKPKSIFAVSQQIPLQVSSKARARRLRKKRQKQAEKEAQPRQVFLPGTPPQPATSSSAQSSTRTVVTKWDRRRRSSEEEDDDEADALVGDLADLSVDDVEIRPDAAVPAQ